MIKSSIEEGGATPRGLSFLFSSRRLPVNTWPVPAEMLDSRQDSLVLPTRGT